MTLGPVFMTASPSHLTLASKKDEGKTHRWTEFRWKWIVCCPPFVCLSCMFVVSGQILERWRFASGSFLSFFSIYQYREEAEMLESDQWTNPPHCSGLLLLWQNKPDASSWWWLCRASPQILQRYVFPLNLDSKQVLLCERLFDLI